MTEYKVRQQRIDGTTYQEFSNDLNSIQDTDITLDFSEVKMITSVGIGAILKATHRGQKIKVINASNLVIEIFKVIGLDESYISNDM